MANTLRAEWDWIVDGETYTLRLSLGDLKALQKDTGIPTLQWQRRLQEQNFGMDDIDAILTRALRNADPQKFRRPLDIAAVLEAAGFLSCLEAAVSILHEALRDPRERTARAPTEGTADPLP